MNIRVSEYFKSIAAKNSPLWRQFTPDPRESEIKEYETSDPLGENSFKVVNSLVHRYKNRALLLVSDSCLMYCRHCFRRDYVDNRSGSISTEDLENACSYIKNSEAIEEVLLSGGDPLILSPKKLGIILDKLRESKKDLVIRVGSRVPIVDPCYITTELIDVLRKYGPIWLSIQCNHPDELTESVRELLHRLRVAGVEIVNQSVLLKGVNDNVSTLKKLSNRLLLFGVKPYYIFQGDLAKGTSHLRVPIERGLKIIKELRSEVSGLGMPTYAVDIPGGGGKIPLTSDYITGEDDRWIYLTNRKGFIGKYPKE